MVAPSPQFYRTYRNIGAGVSGEGSPWTFRLMSLTGRALPRINAAGFESSCAGRWVSIKAMEVGQDDSHRLPKVTRVI
jgi:hypothetical protein